MIKPYTSVLAKNPHSVSLPKSVSTGNQVYSNINNYLTQETSTQLI